MLKAQLKQVTINLEQYNRPDYMNFLQQLFAQVANTENGIGSSCRFFTK